MDFAAMPAEWPHAAHSRMVACAPHRWHVQVMGAGPVVLLLHGAGGATHSWRDLMPLLAGQYTVVAVDLPGQGFSRAGSRSRLSLDAMAADLGALMADQGWNVAAIVGHSAGAALALRMAQGGGPRAVVALNGALGKFRGLAGWLFPAMAKMLALNPLSAALFARTAGSGQSVRSLISGTGSTLDARGLELYRALVRDRGHVDGTLGMMAGWRLDALLEALPYIHTPTLFIAAENDRAVPPDTSDQAAARMGNARCIRLAGLGHLAHEEAPEVVAPLILAFLAEMVVSDD
ncbi:alpha/beta fold hydrolase BchO [Roseicitreum antarcticum]|uniref:Magnesium chelatase accessory protein n=1 Tax=Roseicitreum antarcticum TaxID=564137 RepID=A0A1H2QIM0_9RHOB|nr:alpha/beta fold hydrolase BchO [Roseicitreum antarcticum]SDW06986.1 magnesium chelatase accessory protein [Roseicitreum antarcticum]